MRGATKADKAMVATTLADDAGAGTQANSAAIPLDPTIDEQRKRQLLAVFELSRVGLTTCVHCQGNSLIRWGSNRRDLRRWQCRDCDRAFTEATGTALAHVHSLEKLRVVAVDMLARIPCSCRELATRLGVNRMTVWRWRRLIAAIWARLHPSPTANDGQAATVLLRESRKASREWVEHYRDPYRHPAPDRLRWLDYRQLDLPLPEPMDRYRVPVQLATAQSYRAAPQPFATNGQWHHPVDGHVPTAAALGNASALLSCDTDDRAEAGSAHPTMSANDNTLPVSVSRLFHVFLAPFRGPATRHLDTYTAWFAARSSAARQPQRGTTY